VLGSNTKRTTRRMLWNWKEKPMPKTWTKTKLLNYLLKTAKKTCGVVFRPDDYRFKFF